jgi:tetratricopeptide (TPR) repeat protein
MLAREAVRVTASLTDVDTGDVVRTTKVDGTLPAIFDLQDRLAQELAGWLRAASSPDRRASPETVVVDAYEAFSRGLLNRGVETYEALDRAVTLFERAVRLDPAYARAHIELGVAYATKADYLSMSELRARALSSLRRAVELQPESGRGWRELGWLLTAMGQHAEGMAAIRRALAIDPDDATAYPPWRGRCSPAPRGSRRRRLVIARSSATRRPAGTRCSSRTAARSCATSIAAATRPRARWNCRRRFSRAAKVAVAGGYMRAGHLAALQDRFDDAPVLEREIDFLVRTEHPLRNRILVELNARLGGVYRQLGDGRKANALFHVALESFERRVRLGADDPFTKYYAAAVHAMCGEAEPALTLLERALAELPAFTAARARSNPSSTVSAAIPGSRSSWLACRRIRRGRTYRHVASAFRRTAESARRTTTRAPSCGRLLDTNPPVGFLHPANAIPPTARSQRR